MSRLIGPMVIVFFAMLVKYGCGDPEVKEYTPRDPNAATATAGTATAGTATAGTATAGTATSGNDDTCLTAFTTNVSDKLTACRSCHKAASGTDAEDKVIPEEAAGARTALLGFFENKQITDGASYTKFMTAADPYITYTQNGTGLMAHGGANQTGALPEASVSTWLTAEASCE